MRLGQAVGPEQGTADHLRQQVAALRLGAELVDREAGEGVHADAEGDAGPAGGELLDHLQVHLVGLAAAADVLTEGQTQQAGVAEQPEDLAREALLPLVLPGLGGQLGVGQLARQGDEVPGLLGGQFTVDQHGSPQDGGAATVPAVVSAPVRSAVRKASRRADCSFVRLAPAEWDDPDVQRLAGDQQAELRARYDGGTEPGTPPSAADLALVLVARDDDGTAIGCGALRGLADGVGGAQAHVRGAVRARPWGRGAVLAALEEAARERGWTTLRLETGPRQPEAIALYTGAGYRPIEAFGAYVGRGRRRLPVLRAGAGSLTPRSAARRSLGPGIPR